MLATSVGSAQDVEFRAVGGAWTAACRVGGAPRDRRVPRVLHGLFEVDFLRGHVAHFDADLNVDWTRLLPCPAVFEEVSMRGAMPPAR